MPHTADTDRPRSRCHDFSRIYRNTRDGGWPTPEKVDWATDKLDWQKLRPSERLALLADLVLMELGWQTIASDWSKFGAELFDESRTVAIACCSRLTAEKWRIHEFHRHLLERVTPTFGNPSRFHLNAFDGVLAEHFEATADAARRDATSEHVADAIVAHSFLGEGVLAKTGVETIRKMLRRADAMPRLREMMAIESRRIDVHVDFGFEIIADVAVRTPEICSRIRERLEESFEPTLSIMREHFRDHQTVHHTGAEALTCAIGNFSDIDERLERTLPCGKLDLPGGCLDVRTASRKREATSFPLAE